jgi:hypothetical protein
MAKLPKIDKSVQRRFIISFLILSVVFVFFFWVFIETQRTTIEKHHITHIEKADILISSTLKQARLNDYIVAKEIVELLEIGGKKEVLEGLIQIEEREERVGVLLDSDVLLVIDQEGFIVARGELVGKKRIELAQEGHIKDGWIPSSAFEQALTMALNGNVDVRKIIYDRNFLRREGYDRFGLPGMGLTIMTPVIDKENDKQVGVLIRVSFVNEHKELVGAIKAVTGVAFTAILPTGEVVGSFFAPKSAEKIKPSQALVAAAEERREKIIGKELEWKTENFVLEEYTVEEIKLTHHDETSAYYRVVYWLELDDYGNFASLRGISMEIDAYLEQKNFLIGLILIVLLSFLIIFGSFYLLIRKKLVYPITSFIGQLKTKKEDKKIEISKHYQEFKELEEAFNSSFNQVKEARDILEVKVKERTKELKELAVSLDKQVKEKTREIQEKMEELEKFNKLAIGRELRMIEIKKELEELKKKLNNESEGKE